MSYQAVPIQDRVDIDNLFSAYAYTVVDGYANGWIACTHKTAYSMYRG